LIGSGNRPVERRSIGHPAFRGPALMEHAIPDEDMREEAQESDVVYADGAGTIHKSFVVQ